ncbi:MAG: fibronectin type III domain-containing protein [Deltaproteobacteria bacterium]|nr:fibronectin type III domain-containing protein [Deltaproteobacteria bacterium]
MKTVCLLIALMLVPGLNALAQNQPTGLHAFDTPSDEGQSITLEWEGEEDRLITVMRATSPDGDYVAAGEALASDNSFTDTGLTEGTDYYYRLAYPAGMDTIYTAPAGPMAPRSNWFRKHRINTLVLTALMFVALMSYIHIAKGGKELYIRRIAGLSALDESVGRATEMGKKIFYIPGILSISEIQTIASLSILGHVAKQTAIYGAKMEVPNIDPLTFSAARETVKQVYAEAGKPDQFTEDMVTYITYDQFAYAAGVSGKMVREKPAANFLIGSFFAESLILAETGNSVGAIQIAGTADIAQLPFFVTTCDYTLLGEELYAASAYLSREPVLLGSIKAQDTVKAIIMATIGAGIVIWAFGSDIIRQLLLAR